MLNSKVFLILLVWSLGLPLQCCFVGTGSSFFLLCPVRPVCYWLPQSWYFYLEEVAVSDVFPCKWIVYALKVGTGPLKYCTHETKKLHISLTERTPYIGKKTVKKIWLDNFSWNHFQLTSNLKVVTVVTSVTHKIEMRVLSSALRVWT